MITAQVTEPSPVTFTAEKLAALTYASETQQPLTYIIGFPEVRAISGLSQGLTDVKGAASYQLSASGASIGTSTANATGSLILPASGLAEGTSTATAGAAQTLTVSGTSAGITDVKGGAVSLVFADGTSAGTSTTTGTATGEAAYSPEAQAVLDRMVNTTTKQKDAIAVFVDTLVASGDWDELYDVHCMSLGAVDYLTGWKVNAGMTPVASPVHTENDGVQFSTTSYMDLGYSAEALHLALGKDSVCVGGDVKTSANSGSNFDLCGVVSGAGVNDFYVRNRLNNDIQTLLGSSGTTPRLSPVTYPMTGFWHCSQETVNRFIQHNTSSTSSGSTATNATTWKGDNIIYNGRNNSGIQNGNAHKTDFFYLGTAAVNADNMKAAIEQFRLDIL